MFKVFEQNINKKFAGMDQKLVILRKQIHEDIAAVIEEQNEYWEERLFETDQRFEKRDDRLDNHHIRINKLEKIHPGGKHSPAVRH